MGGCSALTPTSHSNFPQQKDSSPPSGSQSSVGFQQPMEWSGRTGPLSARPQQRGLNWGAEGLKIGAGISEPQSWPEVGDQLPQYHIQLLAASHGQLAQLSSRLVSWLQKSCLGSPWAIPCTSHSWTVRSGTRGNLKL